MWEMYKFKTISKIDDQKGVGDFNIKVAILPE